MPDTDLDWSVNLGAARHEKRVKHYREVETRALVQWNKEGHLAPANLFPGSVMLQAAICFAYPFDSDWCQNCMEGREAFFRAMWPWSHRPFVQAAYSKVRRMEIAIALVEFQRAINFKGK